MDCYVTQALPYLAMFFRPRYLKTRQLIVISNSSMQTALVGLNQTSLKFLVVYMYIRDCDIKHNAKL